MRTANPINRHFPASGWITTKRYELKSGDINERLVYCHYGDTGKIVSQTISSEMVPLVREAIAARKPVLEILELLNLEAIAA